MRHWIRKARTNLRLVRRALRSRPADWVEELRRDFQDRIVAGTYQGLLQLDDQTQDRVMQCQARTCMEGFVELYDLDASLDLDRFLDRIANGAGPSEIDIERDGETIVWRERHHGQCMCPLVARGVVPANEMLCRCSVHWVRMLIERHARRPAEVELAESVARGDQDCVFRIRLLPENRAG